MKSIFQDREGKLTIQHDGREEVIGEKADRIGIDPEAKEAILQWLRDQLRARMKGERPPIPKPPPLIIGHDHQGDPVEFDEIRRDPDIFKKLKSITTRGMIAQELYRSTTRALRRGRNLH